MNETQFKEKVKENLTIILIGVGIGFLFLYSIKDRLINLVQDTIQQIIFSLIQFLSEFADLSLPFIAALYAFFVAHFTLTQLKKHHSISWDKNVNRPRDDNTGRITSYLSFLKSKTVYQYGPPVIEFFILFPILYIVLNNWLSQVRNDLGRITLFWILNLGTNILLCIKLITSDSIGIKKSIESIKKRVNS